MQTQYTFIFSGADGRGYNFTIPATSEREALEKLAKDFGLMIGEIQQEVAK